MQHVEQAVYTAVQRVAAEKSLAVGHVQAHYALVDDIGFSSLDLARIIAIAELALDANPFASLVPITSIRTVGDLCVAYAKCFADGAEASSLAAAADASSERAPPATRRRGAHVDQRELRRQIRGEAS
jgi:acyl carrier protein